MVIIECNCCRSLCHRQPPKSRPTFGSLQPLEACTAASPFEILSVLLSWVSPGPSDKHFWEQSATLPSNLRGPSTAGTEGKALWAPSPGEIEAVAGASCCTPRLLSVQGLVWVQEPPHRPPPRITSDHRQETQVCALRIILEPGPGVLKFWQTWPESEAGGPRPGVPGEARGSESEGGAYPGCLSPGTRPASLSCGSR